MTPVDIKPDPYLKCVRECRLLHDDIRKLKSIMAEMYRVLDLADDDIREHLQVANYNLYGKINTGEFIKPPNPPEIIHERGINASLEVRNSIRLVRKLYRDNLTEEDIKLQEMDKLK
jgi:hypothetical protein